MTTFWHLFLKQFSVRGKISCLLSDIYCQLCLPILVYFGWPVETETIKRLQTLTVGRQTANRRHTVGRQIILVLLTWQGFWFNIIHDNFLTSFFKTIFCERQNFMFALWQLLSTLPPYLGVFWLASWNRNHQKVVNLRMSKIIKTHLKWQLTVQHAVLLCGLVHSKYEMFALNSDGLFSQFCRSAAFLSVSLSIWQSVSQSVSQSVDGSRALIIYTVLVFMYL